ncbi:hypothetical protein RFI_30776 [Reticulomyxa filosa]|uniref:HIRAN domain-containing protein n=1 Tax=Reticulomyxa filosa TaxID=46433 RepID=X6M0W5_RETFI|nr:hypothetical protein RFI_30776 [Reticulomyxa filosa]|eukprot:ETO06620.1 hypothetical protein RFI_30776 [Reticulomyxa filosa]
MASATNKKKKPSKRQYVSDSDPEPAPEEKKSEVEVEPKKKRRRIIDSATEAKKEEVDNRHVFGYIGIDFKRSHKHYCENRANILSRYDDGDGVLKLWSDRGTGRQVRTCCQELYDNNWEFSFVLEPENTYDPNAIVICGKKDNAKLGHIPGYISKLLTPCIKDKTIVLEQFRFDKDKNEHAGNWDPTKIRKSKAIIKVLGDKPVDLPAELKSLLKSKPEECD